MQSYGPEVQKGANLLQFLQLFDTSFPLGAYAHTFGLEEAVSSCRPQEDPTTAMISWINVFLNNLKRNDLAVFYTALKVLDNCEAMDNDQLFEDLVELSLALTASRLTKENRQAALQSGSQLARLAIQLWESESLLCYLTKCSADEIAPEHYLILAILTNSQSWAPLDVGVASTLTCVRTLVTNCQRLIPLGQLSAQQIISYISNKITEVVQSAMNLPIEELLVGDVTLDYFSMRHETTSGRLFLS